MPGTEIYIATVLLERNRWKPGKEPTLRVSDWLGRFAAAGFDGIELWENHALKAPDDEVARLAAAVPPVRIFNSYATFGPEDDPLRARAAEMALRLGAGAVKFNVGGDPSLFDVYVANVLRWRETLPESVRPLCECHPGTVVERPEEAARAFAVWRQAGIGAIFHPFNLGPDGVRRWLAYLGDSLVHAHVQVHREGRMRSLAAYKEYAAAVLDALKSEGFRGTFSIEFTEGAGAADEDIEQLFAAACMDLATLRRLL